MESLLEINQKLENLGYTLDLFTKADEESLYTIFRQVVDTGSQFPYECNSKEEFYRRFFGPDSQVYVCHATNGEVVGGFYVRTNYPGRSNHIANAAYMMLEKERGKGIGTLLIKASLHFAKMLGHSAMQFNLVLSSNKGAIELYKKLGFKIIGTIPDGVRNPNGSFQDGYVMYRNIVD